MSENKTNPTNFYLVLVSDRTTIAAISMSEKTTASTASMSENSTTAVAGSEISTKVETKVILFSAFVSYMLTII